VAIAGSPGMKADPAAAIASSICCPAFAYRDQAWRRATQHGAGFARPVPHLFLAYSARDLAAARAQNPRLCIVSAAGRRRAVLRHNGGFALLRTGYLA